MPIHSIREINARFLWNEHGVLYFLFHNLSENGILNNWEKKWQKSGAERDPGYGYFFGKSNKFYRGILVPRGRAPFVWSAPRIATSGQVKHRKSTFHHSAHALSQVWQIWLILVSIYCVYTKPFLIRISLDVARGSDSWYWPKEARPLGTSMLQGET